MPEQGELYSENLLTSTISEEYAWWQRREIGCGRDTCQYARVLNSSTQVCNVIRGPPNLKVRTLKEGFFHRMDFKIVIIVPSWKGTRFGGLLIEGALDLPITFSGENARIKDFFLSQPPLPSHHSMTPRSRFMCPGVSQESII